MKNTIWSRIILCCFFAFGCSSNRVVVERELLADVSLPSGATVEIQSIEGLESESFKGALVRELLDHTTFKVIHSLSTKELIDGKLRGSSNSQSFNQAKYAIRGSIQENIERRYGKNGETQYLATSRPFLQVFDTTSGAVLISRQFIGTSISDVMPQGSIMADEFHSSALNPARISALSKFIEIFQPRKAWIEIDLIEFSDKTRFKEVRGLIEHKYFPIARKILGTYYHETVGNKAEMAKALFTLSVIEALEGKYSKARELLLNAHQLWPEDKIFAFQKQINYLESKGPVLL